MHGPDAKELIVIKHPLPQAIRESPLRCNRQLGKTRALVTVSLAYTPGVEMLSKSAKDLGAPKPKNAKSFRTWPCMCC